MKKQYIKPYNPYELSLKFILERLVILLRAAKQEKVRIIAESRGEKEDNELKLSFYEIIQKGTERIPKTEFQSRKFILSFLPKSMNIIGTQIADLCGYPIGRYILNPHKENKAYEVIKRKIMEKLNGWNCFKVFP
ncbi:MAG: DUF3800 domain-containing protein [Ignavibacteriales bacterium]|nr:DUF3800 domain-containing protein [Ignavibacteriales bacterium]